MEPYGSRSRQLNPKHIIESVKWGRSCAGDKWSQYIGSNSTQTTDISYVDYLMSVTSIRSNSIRNKSLRINSSALGCVIATFLDCLHPMSGCHDYLLAPYLRFSGIPYNNPGNAGNEEATGIRIPTDDRPNRAYSGPRNDSNDYFLYRLLMVKLPSHDQDSSRTPMS